MNFKEYKAWQKTYLEKNPNVFRADCMNPFISMNYLLNKVVFSSEDISQLGLYSKWKEFSGVEIPFENLALSRGVRHSLSKLFHLFKSKTIYMPQDVYPRYFELAKENNIKTFVTYPKTSWESLKEVENSIVSLTIPFTPMGREIEEEDIEQIRALVHRGNRIIIDSVYDYNLCENFKKLKVLLEEGSVFWLHSLSKTYLSPEVLGIVYLPSYAYQLYFKEAFDDYEFKDEVSYNRTYDILTQTPTLPSLQQKAFNKGFDYLSENTVLDVCNSEIAYFSVIEESFETLLKHNVLGVPASVFGSKNKNLTVVTGLFYLSELED
jgi:hypothetical protein